MNMGISRSRPPIPKSFTFRHTILGLSTDTPWRRGRVGTNIPESGSVARISRLDLVLESGSSAASDGDGAIGDLIGATITRSLVTAAISPRAERFTTATPFTVAARAADSEELADLMDRAAEFLIVLARDQGPSRAAGRRPGVMPRRVVRAMSAPELSATTTMAESRGVIHPVEPPASVAEHRAVEEGSVAVVGVAEDVAANCRY